MDNLKYAYINGDEVQYIFDEKEYNSYSEDFKGHCAAFDPEAVQVEVGMRYINGEFLPPLPEPPDPEPEPEAHGITIEDLMEAVAELAEKQEADKLETQEALAELAELMV